MAVISRSGLSAVRDKRICNIWRLVEPEKPSCPFVFQMRLKKQPGTDVKQQLFQDFMLQKWKLLFCRWADRSSGLKMVNDHKHQRHPDIIFIYRLD